MKRKFFLGLTLLLALGSLGATNTAYDVINMNDIDKTKVMFYGVGVGAEVPAGAVDHVIELPMTDDVFLTGAQTKITGACPDDKVKIQIISPSVDLPGIPANTMMVEFINWWAMDMDTQIPYPSKIRGGFKIRALYTNTCTTTIKVRINYHLHKILI